MNKEQIDTLHHTNLIIPTIPYRYNLDIDCFQNDWLGILTSYNIFFNIVPEDFSFKIQVNRECYLSKSLVTYLVSGHPQSKE